MAISRSLGVVTVNRAGSIDGLALFASTFFLLRFHFFQQGIQALEISFPELSIPLEPSVGFSEPSGFETPRAPLRVAPARDQSGALEHFEMFRNRRLAHGEGCSQLVPESLARNKPRQNSPPCAVRQRRKDGVQLRRCRLSITSRLHNHMEIY